MDNNRLMIAMFLAVVVLVVSDYLLPKPQQPVVASHIETTESLSHKPSPPGFGGVLDVPDSGASASGLLVAREDKRIAINAPSVKGTINLRGARLDDLVLKKYRETVEQDSTLVRVLNNDQSNEANYIEFGWVVPSGSTISLPDASTLWTSNNNELTVDQPVVLSWDNHGGQIFKIRFSVDQHFMFSVTQTVENNTNHSIIIYPYARVLRSYKPETNGGFLVHEGPIAVMNGRLQESSYNSVESAKNPQWMADGIGGWVGITDKYWLSAVMPSQDSKVSASFSYAVAYHSYQTGYITSVPLTVPPNSQLSYNSNAFAGAKEVHLLEKYEHDLNLPLFWKAVDFGWFAFLTRPIFYILDWLNIHLGNFGLALMAFTLIVKALFFPLATRQFRSMARMRNLQPRMAAIREQHKDDPAGMNQRIMAMYKEEGVNPLGGCLPLLLQVPVFWCLYKDLYVTIEMRHAPFFGWIRDLSAMDPSNIFNFFGLIPWDPTSLTPLLHIGFWSIIFGVTMLVQQKLNPAPVDPMQARIFAMMPIIFTFVLARQPVGLVIYYCWNNLLTIIQQFFIQRSHNQKDHRPKTLEIAKE